MEGLLKITDVCKILNVSDDTIRRDLKELRIAGTKIRGGWRFTPDAVQDYIKSRTMKIKKQLA